MTKETVLRISAEGLGYEQYFCIDQNDWEKIIAEHSESIRHVRDDAETTRLFFEGTPFATVSASGLYAGLQRTMEDPYPIESHKDEYETFKPLPEPKKGVNPKDLLGVQKVSLSKFPAIALIHGAHAMMDGARKYGPYNWRGNPVLASIYIDAGIRHFLKFFQGQEIDPDSGARELGHAMSCAAIVLDAQASGNLVDDRPTGDDPGLVARVMDEVSAAIKAKQGAK